MWRSLEKRCRAEYRLPPHSRRCRRDERIGTPRQPFWIAVASGIPRETAADAGFKVNITIAPADRLAQRA
jgi:hypothetical protein